MYRSSVSVCSCICCVSCLDGAHHQRPRPWGILLRDAFAASSGEPQLRCDLTTTVYIMLYECDVPADDRDVLRGGAGLGKGIVRRRSILGVSSCCYLLGGNYLAKC
ncbi:PREDICTED: uncharacterized protein LOC105564599 isoform X2 [Vollenhovia emeryi]|uniref:uncharacterized protein LOC105564599 isoform X2 n=1 Tax=Vollenhovia emeryi TaxID=411798 RepID=UPI0005F442C7|nr:PREDICTED: uncharacterized protein LOC105564599 isoform X2 [Vollenhovia emeryi]